MIKNIYQSKGWVASECWVAGICGNSTLVGLAPGHHDVTTFSPAFAPAKNINKTKVTRIKKNISNNLCEVNRINAVF